MTREHAATQLVLLAALVALDAHAAAPATRPAPTAEAIPARPATLRLVVTLEIQADGSTRLVSSEPLTPDMLGHLAEVLAADRAEAAVRAARIERAAVPPARAEKLLPRTGKADGPGAKLPASKAPFPGQCTAVAESTGERCRMHAAKGSDRCRFHVDRD